MLSSRFLYGVQILASVDLNVFSVCFLNEKVMRGLMFGVRWSIMQSIRVSFIDILFRRINFCYYLLLAI